jgi:glycosyltransferase involved in cell wall biosynthesis
MPLRVAAKVDPPDVDYWERDIRPLFEANDVDFLGEITEADKPSFFAEAAALLFPIDWPEPFGLVMVESMAAGTPVVALNRGAVGEVIDDGVTGFICRDLDEMVCSVSRVGDLDPQQIRAGGRRFSSETMVDTYLDMYKDVLVERRPTPRYSDTYRPMAPRTEQTKPSTQEATSASVA